MTRYFLSCLAVTACLFCLTGCGSNEAEFTPTDAPSADEQAEAEKYEEAMDPAKMEEAMKTGKDPFPLNN
jgi:predicted small lipoprotein YifL